LKVEILKPTLLDVKEMQSVVFKEVKDGIILDRNENEMATTIRSYQIAKVNGAIVGFVALHIHSPILAEIRSLVVSEEYRKLKIGAKLVNDATAEGVKLGVKQVLVLTYQKEFFEKLGFVEIEKESIPDSKIWADCIKCKHFPICNEISLIKEI
jgi:amino-acid N-acetyltransferase